MLNLLSWCWFAAITSQYLPQCMAYLLGFSWDSNLACFFLLDVFVLVYFYLPCYVLFFRKHKCCWQQVWEPRRVEISFEACSQQVSVFGAGGFPWQVPWISIPAGDPHQNVQNFSCGPFCKRDCFLPLSFFFAGTKMALRNLLITPRWEQGAQHTRSQSQAHQLSQQQSRALVWRIKALASFCWSGRGQALVLQGPCEECVGGDCALLSGIFALCTCFSLVVPLFCAFDGWPPILPQGQGLKSPQVSLLLQDSQQDFTYSLLGDCVMLRNLSDGSQLFILFPNVYSPLTLAL